MLELVTRIFHIRVRTLEPPEPGPRTPSLRNAHVVGPYRVGEVRAGEVDNHQARARFAVSFLVSYTFGYLGRSRASAGFRAGEETNMASVGQ